MTEREDTVKTLERVLDLTHKKSITVTIPKHTAELAVSMLKEQEAVKPVVNQDEWACGCCRTLLERQRMIHPGAIFHDFFEYCPHCGKKVDWKAVDPDADEG